MKVVGPVCSTIPLQILFSNIAVVDDKLSGNVSTPTESDHVHI